MRFLERFNSKKKYIENVDKVDIVLFGDSWLDYWTDEKFIENDRTFFDDIVKFNLDAINVGVGGTEFSDWLPLLDEFVIKLNPNKVFICLGSNDTYNGKSVEEVFIDFKKTIQALKNKLPFVKIFMTPILQCKATERVRNEEIAFNKLIKEYAKITQNLIVLDLEHLLFKDGQLVDNIDEYFISDNMHLSRKGYDLWGYAVLDALK